MILKVLVFNVICLDEVIKNSITSILFRELQIIFVLFFKYIDSRGH